MLKTYQGLFILRDSLKDDALDQVIERISAEVARMGGEVAEVTKQGKQIFARPMKKRTSGFYVRTVLNLPPGRVADLYPRFKLDPDVFRVQITIRHAIKKDESIDAPTAEAGPAAEPVAAGTEAPVVELS